VTANRFFIPRPALPESRLWIEGREHHHLSRVARVRRGETIGLCDEEGGQYQAVVEEVSPHRTPVRIISRQEAEPPAAPLARACLLVGPEGGWSAAEEKRIQAFGFRPVSLGRSILRTETAALCAAFLINHFWNS
jgi:16S rRNA U1498 N3-methylase RsmE